MAENQETRKLAAVMFADIEGYTALFQQNEAGALAMLDQHHEDLRKSASAHRGEVLKYYGDGSLTLFTSVIEAVRCAIELQQLSRDHHIPLRTGMHMGEMIEKENDVYGDAVNVASRIQAMGTAGSVLVSKVVVDELKNHPSIHTKSLGSIRLKNIAVPVEVFAVNAPGLSIPQVSKSSFRSWRKPMIIGLAVIAVLAIAAFLLRGQLRSHIGLSDTDAILIPPFISLSKSADKDSLTFSMFAASRLTKLMSESIASEVIPFQSMLLYNATDLASLSDNDSAARQLGARYRINGSYVVEGDHSDSLHVWVSILDLQEDQILPYKIPDVICRTDQPGKCIDQLGNILAGYWKSSKDSLFQFTNDSAYTYFVLAQKNWAQPDRDRETESFLLKAIRKDPKFLDAWFLLLDLYYNSQNYKQGSITIKEIITQFPGLNERQRDQLNYYQYGYEGKNVLAFQSFLPEYRQHPKYIFVNTPAMVLASESLNDPNLTLQIFEQIDPSTINLNTCVYCATRFFLALIAYTDLGQMQKAGMLADKLKPFAVKTSHFTDLLYYYVREGDTTRINDVIRAGINTLDASDTEPYLCLTAARLAATSGNNTLQKLYADRAERLYQHTDEINIARAYMLLGESAKARARYEMKLQGDETRAYVWAYLGVLYARAGETDRAEKMIAQLDKHKPPFDFGYTPYYQARIKANLGDMKGAMYYLKIALEEGIGFFPTSTFLNDPDMIPMNLHPGYLELLARNRLYKIE